MAHILTTAPPTTREQHNSLIIRCRYYFEQLDAPTQRALLTLLLLGIVLWQIHHNTLQLIVQ